ncbi:hypothetical protein ATANTOWER_000951 [Ataeniobius toweri]|uniref:Uncharacterized protein n=1 Tax=Ataeniobius toweri TaxID=208326 RepID=A0ABU7AWM6_9TELE|nr:hypothetical protein [Ataeniobius toweri]
MPSMSCLSVYCFVPASSETPIYVSLPVEGWRQTDSLFPWMDEENREKGGGNSGSPPQSLSVVITGDLQHHQRDFLMESGAA